MRVYVNFYDLCEDCQLSLDHPEGGFLQVTERICPACLKKILRALVAAI